MVRARYGDEESREGRAEGRRVWESGRNEMGCYGREYRERQSAKRSRQLQFLELQTDVMNESAHSRRGLRHSADPDWSG